MQLQILPSGIRDPPQPSRVFRRQHLRVSGGAADAGSRRFRLIPGDAQQRRQIVRRHEDAGKGGIDEDAIDEDAAAFEALEELGTVAADEKVLEGGFRRLRTPFRLSAAVAAGGTAG